MATLVSWTGVFGIALVLLTPSGCAGTVPSGGVAPGLEPRSTEFRAEYCAAIAADEAERARSSRRTGHWLVGIGVGALTGAAATYAAASQTEREQTDKTLNTLGSSLALAGLAALVSGATVLATNRHHDDHARLAASLATDIAAEGELPLADDSDEARTKALRERDEKTRPLFRRCLGLAEVDAATPEAEKRANATSSGGPK